MLLIALCLVLAEPPLSAQVARIETEFAAIEKAFDDDLHAAKHDKDKVSKANEVYNVKWHEAIKELEALIKRHPEDPAALDGVIVLTGAMRSFLDDELTKVALRSRDDARMGKLCFNLRQRSGEPWAEAIVNAVAESNPSRDVRGQAIYCQGYLRRGEAFPYGRSIPQETRDALIAQARTFFVETTEKYADVRTPDGKTTLGVKAAHELKRFDNLPSLKVGGMAPEIEGEDLEGRPLKLGDHRGKVAVVVFWGSWCGPCMAMVPHEKELWERHHGKAFALIGVNCGDEREKARKTAADKQMGWPSFYDGEEISGPIETDYDIQRLPTVYVIDPKGVIRYIDVHAKELDMAVETLLAEVK